MVIRRIANALRGWWGTFQAFTIQVWQCLAISVAQKQPHCREVEGQNRIAQQIMTDTDKALYREPTGLFDREVIQDHAMLVVTAEPVEAEPVRPDFAPLDRTATPRTDERGTFVNVES
jgi:hypothetical protein